MNYFTHSKLIKTHTANKVKGTLQTKKKFCARRLAQSTGSLREELKIGAFFRLGNMASRDQNFSSSEDESTGEVRIHEELPRGSERDVIEHYFYKGLPYRQIVLMLEKHHNLIMNQRTLKRRLKDFGLYIRGVKRLTKNSGNASRT